MNFSKSIKNKNNHKFNPNDICKNLYKGACVKIKNNNNTFQVIGLNQEKKICWVREWPFNCNSKKTFALNISQITIQVLCSNDFTKGVVG